MGRWGSTRTQRYRSDDLSRIVVLEWRELYKTTRIEVPDSDLADVMTFFLLGAMLR